jgi:hypothetical protein
MTTISLYKITDILTKKKKLLKDGDVIKEEINYLIDFKIKLKSAMLLRKSCL